MVLPPLRTLRASSITPESLAFLPRLRHLTLTSPHNHLETKAIISVISLTVTFSIPVIFDEEMNVLEIREFGYGLPRTEITRENMGIFVF